MINLTLKAMSVLGLLGAGVYFMAVAVLTWWAEREQARQDAERKRLSRIMDAGTPRAAGLNHRRIS